ncbi:rna-directed dna polymerase from mobile element jockey-like [Limosa lapponica baueri]|uniref:Rna-directed dna polymerase from mobile element jockey-like n=1 Tax=Limosa lapponica baueri TaxID=1758121 RepID=A0A2I0TWK6_LIMLA|nr:rna-directed dna polymerase from mobile element jockey-like [Limosa lapponica baueri]
MTRDQLLTRFNSIHCHSLGPALQPVFNPAESNPIPAMGNQFLQEDTVVDCFKDLTKVQVKNIHNLSLIHQAGHFVTEGDQVCQAGPAPHEPMLAGPDRLGLLHAQHNGTQDDLFHDLPRHRGQTDRPVVPQIIPPALLVDGHHICSMLVSCDLPSLPGLMVNDGKWLSKTKRNFKRYVPKTGAECTLCKFADDMKLGGVTDRPEGCAAIQRDLNRLEKWADRNLTKFNKGKCKVLPLGRSKPWRQYMLRTTQLEKSLAEKDLGFW